MENNENQAGGSKIETLFKPKFKQPKFDIKLKLSWKIRGLLLLLVIIVVAYSSLLEYVKPNEFGIKVVKIGIGRGVQKKVYETGLHLVLPFGMQQMHKLPRDIQVLELTNYENTASQYARIKPAAHIQTSDGFFVVVDVSIIYRIVDPYKVFTIIGPGKLFEDNGIIPKAEPTLKDSLGQLTTEDFFNSPKRVEKSNMAKRKLNEELESKGIHVDHVLVRYFKYSDEIQKNIEEKKLKDQLVFKNQAEARAAVENAKLTRIVQEGKVIVIVELEKGKAYVTRKKAEKDLYYRKKIAQADLLVKLADAEKIRLKNDALKGKGAERMVGLKMAEVLKGLDVIILPSDGSGGVNPLDLNKSLELFDVRKGDK
ncbi:SPFH domain-containing protein [Desulfobacula toluolica]|uniref:SPFH domain / band 7 family membrane protein n=1 Tax=Desulfobacula toluolica (strain DSM 7467 / Tol2) TaxID=651182 RepID=K0NK31_DESTT|nr:SPFH domain-containing protein [Desulfobacula toluolica]CCK81881.1 SPFH domain / band 7 family membrane protein [Desulfobacula toluolica Tol2]